MVRTVLITGANAGLGRETARQLAMLESTDKVYLACRNKDKAEDARRSLEEATGRSIFGILALDTSDLTSVRAAVQSLDQPVEGLVMNAGGIVGQHFSEQSPDGVTWMMAANLLGHVVLLEELLQAQKLTQVAIFSSSETARGVSQVGLKPPRMDRYSVDEFAAVCDGSFFDPGADFKLLYQYVKYMGALYMSAMARRHDHLHLLTVSPGSTSGTDIYANAPLRVRLGLKVLKILPLKRIREKGFHRVEDGAKRYVDALNDESYRTGAFYASKKRALVGPMVEQGTFFEDLNCEQYQDNAFEALHRFTG